MSLKKIRVYLASPLGFTRSTKEFMDLLEAAISSGRHTVVNPWKLACVAEFSIIVKNYSEIHSVDMDIAKKNKDSLDGCDVVVAVLDGTDVDSGTASEIGYAYAKGKLIYGYREDTRRSGENIGVCVNLQVQYFIEASGGKIFNDLDSLKSFFVEK
jgi:nucleoside 2-deoxyribosyltransferase